MAKVTIQFKIDGVEQEIQSVDDLNKVMGKLVDENKEVQDAQDKTTESGKKQTQQNDKTEKGFTTLQRQIKETSKAMQQAAAAGDKLKFEELRGQLDELNDEFDKVKLQSGQLDDQLTQLPGAAGQAGGAFKGLNDTIKIFMANPILALITAIVGAFMLMKKSLESSAEGQATLNRVSSAFSKILGPVMALVEKVALPVFNGLALVIEKVAGALTWVVESLGISGAKIKEHTKNIDTVQQELDKKNAERADAEKKRTDELTAKRKAAHDKQVADTKAANAKAAAAEQKRIADHEEVLKKLKELQDKELTDTVEIARAQVLAQKEADMKMFRDKKASKEEMLKLTEAYAILEKQAVEKAQKEKDEKAQADIQKEKDRATAQTEWLTGFKIQMVEKSYADQQNAINIKEAESLEAAKKRYDEGLATEEEYEKAKGQIALFYADQRNQKALENEQAKADLLANFRLSQAENAFAAEEEMIALEEQRALAEIERLKGTEEEKAKITAFYDDLRLKNKQAMHERELQLAAGAFGDIAGLLGKETAAAKAASIAQATINTYLGASQVMKDPTIVPTWLKPIMAGIAIASGLKQVKEIMAVEPPKMATGGWITGPSHANGGVPIEAEGGEFIINKHAMANPGVAQLAMSLNSVARPKFANGGPVPSIAELQSNLQNAVQVPIRTYVVSDEMTSSQEATAKINRLAKL